MKGDRNERDGKLIVKKRDGAINQRPNNRNGK